MTVCIIPARGGSKRIPRKNIRFFCGRPMITWSIQAALNSGCFDDIVVSTDNLEIATIARESGASAPFLRSGDLSDDYTPTVPVIADAIRQLGLPDDEPVCCLYATAPFVQAEDLGQGLSILKHSKANFVVSITTYAFPIQRALIKKEGGDIEMIDPSQTLTRSQDLVETWHDAGQFYWGEAASWLSAQGIFTSGAYGVALPRYRVQDIDTLEDWQRAEMMMHAQLGRQKT